jgi:hypothetical protein
MNSAKAVPLHLQPVGPSAGIARRYVREALVTLHRGDLDEAAQLGVSELVANVCQHARTPFDLTVAQTDAGAVRIDVRDGCSTVPVQRRQTSLALSGRGLHLLTAAGIWGVTQAPDGTTGKTVWFEPADHISEIPFEPPTADCIESEPW